MAVRRRLHGKQADPRGSAAEQAIQDEGWSELVALSGSAKRKHIHWTHVRTDNPEHRQPHEFTRQEFWDHLLRVYKDVYPEPANQTGSIGFHEALCIVK